MKRTLAWFDRFLKVRIALMLGLDALPILMSLYVIGLIYMEEGCGVCLPDWMNMMGIAVIMFMLCGGGFVIYVFAWLLNRAYPIKSAVPRMVSRALRIFGFIPVMLPFFLMVLIRVAYLFKK